MKTPTCVLACMTMGLAACGGQAAGPDGPVAGMWRTTVTMAGETLPSTEECQKKPQSVVDIATTPLEPGVVCSERYARRDREGYVARAVCEIETIAATKTTITVDARFTGDFAVAYTTHLTGKMDPPVVGAAGWEATIEAQRLGDC